jgi:histidine triad (HIT) family protein
MAMPPSPRSASRPGTGCSFCGIVAGEVPATVVLDEEHVVAFLDVRPVFKGHVLVVPRAHHVTLLDLPVPLVEPLVVAAQRVAGAIVDGLGAQGTFVAMNNVVSQSVPHLHVHVVPRTKGDGLRGFFWPRTGYDDDAEREAFGARIRDALVQVR